MNNLVIEGSPRSIKRFKERNFKDGEFCFSNLIPRPKSIQDAEHTASGMEPLFDAFAGRKPKGGWDWYTWSIAHWRTKWDIDRIFDLEEGIDEELHWISFSFDTAWSPPVEWVNNASSKFPSLEFTLRFGEPGCCFAGEHIACKKTDTNYTTEFPEGSEEYNELTGNTDEEEYDEE